MELLNQLTFDQLKSLSYEQIYNIINSNKKITTEINTKIYDDLIEQINNFFLDCVYGYSPYCAVGLNDIIRPDFSTTEVNHQKMIQLCINKTKELKNPVKSFELMKQIKKICENNNINVYLTFIPHKIETSLSKSTLTSYKDVSLSCDCPEYRQNNSGCPNEMCMYEYITEHTLSTNQTKHRYRKKKIQKMCVLNKGHNTDITNNSNLLAHGYKLYYGINFQAHKKDTLLKLFDIDNIDDFIINPESQNIDSVNLTNHSIDYIMNNHNLVKYSLPWIIYDKTLGSDKSVDFSEHFKFIDMIKLKKYIN